MQKLERLINELEIKIPRQTVYVPTVSKGSVGWHIEHTLLVLNAVIDALNQSDPAKYKKSFDIKRTVVMVLGIIPRGRIKAPTAVQPAISFNSNTLQQHISLTKTKLANLQQLSTGHYFTHPFLGDFKVKPAVRFLWMHTNHHLHIINDILKKANG